MFMLFTLKSADFLSGQGSESFCYPRRCFTSKYHIISVHPSSGPSCDIKGTVRFISTSVSFYNYKRRRILILNVLSESQHLRLTDGFKNGLVYKHCTNSLKQAPRHLRKQRQDTRLANEGTFKRCCWLHTFRLISDAIPGRISPICVLGLTNLQSQAQRATFSPTAAKVHTDGLLFARDG